MSVALEVVEVEVSAGDHAQRINEMHRQIREDDLRAVAKWILLGEEVVETRRLIPSGEWIAWAEENLTCGYSNACKYERMAVYKDLVKDAENIRDAFEILKEAPKRQGMQRNWSVDEARFLREEKGLSYQVIAEGFGVTMQAVRLALNPDLYEENKQRAIEWKRRKAEKKRHREDERKALILLRRTAAAQGFGGGVAEAYSLCRRLLQVLDRVHRDGEAENRRLAGLAYREQMEVEEIIGRMLGVI